MSKRAQENVTGVRPSPMREDRMQWGYDGDRFDPARRVEVWPYQMIGGLVYLSVEAKGFLLTLFCQYWSKDRPVTASFLQGVHRFSRRKTAKIIDEMLWAKAIRSTSEGYVPAGPFGLYERKEQAPRSARDMPADWAALRDVVFERDGYGCVYCGSGLNLHCDHVHPLTLGGSNDIANLVTACATCNLRKGAKTVAEWRPDIAARFGP